MAIASKSPKAAKKDTQGHAAHTQDAESRGLPGEFRRKIKVTFMGAGSGFTPRVVSDILKTPGQQGGTIALVDIDGKRLKTMEQLIKKQLALLGAENWNVIASKDRTKVMKDSDYIVNCIEVSGLACVRHDNDIPAKYGIDQCIGDTMGPGGLFKGLRTVPVFLDVMKDAERLCPKVIVLNYTNPMSMLCLALGRTSPINYVGLCHSVQGTSHLLAKRAGIPYEEMAWDCRGINHLAWFTKLEHKGKDLYPLLKKLAQQDLAGKPADPENDAHDLVRKDMMVQFGAFITESSGHLSEYLPYYRKNEEIKKQYARSGYCGESSFYANNWPTWRANHDKERLALLTGEKPMKWERSWEYASWIIEAREKNLTHRIHGNVMNNGGGTGHQARLIPNLPGNGCVEVPILIDQNGINPVACEPLPAQMAAICDSNMRFFDLAATAVIERSKEAAIHALMLDPLCAAVASPAQIRQMALEMFDAEKEFLPGYR